MAGDCNLFMESMEPGETEIEVMIAEEKSRRKGLAEESLKMLMFYAIEHLGIKRFIAKIKNHNHPSLNLFQKLGFSIEKSVEIFQELHLSFSPNYEQFKIEMGYVTSQVL